MTLGRSLQIQYTARLVLGYRDKVARAKLFKQKECDLKNAIESPRISEATKKQLRKLGDEESATVNAVKGKGQSGQTTTPMQSKGQNN